MEMVMFGRWLGKLGSRLSRAVQLPPVEEDRDADIEMEIEESRSVRARRRIAQAGKPSTIEPQAARVPAGQTVTSGWPRLDDGHIPTLADEDWTVTLAGNGSSRLFTLAELRAMPCRRIATDIHCVTGWSRLDMPWQGVDLAVLAAEAGMSLQTGWAMAHAVDGYCANVPVGRLAQQGAMLALQADGMPLTREHGGPVRLLLPRLYLWKSVKWLSAIEAMPTDRRGTWERRGYHNGGDPWLGQRWSMAERPEDGYPRD